MCCNASQTFKMRVFDDNYWQTCSNRLLSHRINKTTRQLQTRRVTTTKQTRAHNQRMSTPIEQYLIGEPKVLFEKCHFEKHKFSLRFLNPKGTI